MAEVIYGKKCPICGHINPDKAAECEKKCGSLLRVSAQYYKQEEIQEEDRQEIVPQHIQPQAQLPPPEKHEAIIRMPSISPKLYCEFNPNFIVEIKNGDVIGREGNIDVTPLPRSQYISRRHAIFIQQGSNWFLRAESRTNPTIVNFRRLNPGEMEPLKDNDRITLADTTFIFRIS